MAECVMVGWIPLVCCVHTEGEIYSSALKGYSLVMEPTYMAVVATEIPLGDHKSYNWSARTA